jgi:hypothetical protein
MSDFFILFCLGLLIEYCFKKNCDYIVVHYCESTMPSYINWYMDKTNMQVLVLCMSTKKQHVMND